jgi:hypothetical protein
MEASFVSQVHWYQGEQKCCEQTWKCSQTSLKYPPTFYIEGLELLSISSFL